MKGWPNNIMMAYYFDYKQADQSGDGQGDDRALQLDNGRGNNGMRFTTELSQAINYRHCYN